MASITARLAKFSLAISSKPVLLPAELPVDEARHDRVGVTQRGVVVERHPVS